MATYLIEWKTSAQKELKRLDRNVIQRIANTVGSLADNPRPSGVRKMQGSLNSFRIRVGEYRVIYEIIDRRLLIIIIRVRHRKESYR